MTSDWSETSVATLGYNKHKVYMKGKPVLGYGTVNIRGPKTSRNTGPKTGTESGLEMPPKPWAPIVGAHTLVYNLGPFSELIIRAQQRDPIGT